MVVCDRITEPEPGRSLDERRLVAAYRKLPPAQRDAVLHDVELRSFNFPGPVNVRDCGRRNG